MSDELTISPNQDLDRRRNSGFPRVSSDTEIAQTISFTPKREFCITGVEPSSKEI
ncbi:MAG: hypothetical protein IPG53_05945 [Ignavibacteriales bacterium]|nr:hypothetical protein [Ignavibacteriales bacterium]